MEAKAILSKTIVEWHTVRRTYYTNLRECCLDTVLQAKLQRKIDYHTRKLKELA